MSIGPAPHPAGTAGPPAQSLVQHLQEQSTWRLLGLSLLTYGVYAAYYCQRQTRRLNEHLPPDRRIADELPLAVVALNWLSLVFLFIYLAVEPGHSLEDASTFVDVPASISFIVWGFVARGRMNERLDARPGEPQWFHGLWTFLFPPFYFNYKVNGLADAPGRAAAAIG